MAATAAATAAELMLPIATPPGTGLPEAGGRDWSWLFVLFRGGGDGIGEKGGGVLVVVGVMPRPGTEMPAAPRRAMADWLR